MASLNHSNIVKYHHHFSDSSNLYIIIELCSNGVLSYYNQSLSDLVKKRQYLTEPEARYFLQQMLKVLQYMREENVIHRE